MEYTITLAEQEFGVLSAALVELPFKVFAPLISKINKQISEQFLANKQESVLHSTDNHTPSGASPDNL